MQRLIIVGNGFDRSHGLDTQYSDFKEYFERTDDYYFKKFIELYKMYENRLWNEFETVLGELDYDDDTHPCCDGFLPDYGDENWRDSGHHDYEYEIDNYMSTLTDLSGRFKDWIKCIDIENIKKKHNFKESDYFLNFNYTLVLEKIYKIKSDRILHIHGSIADDREIIVGHQNDFAERKIYGDDDYAITDLRVQGGIRSFNNALRSVYKPVEDIISENIEFFERKYDTVYVMGHSMGPVDIKYFEEIFKNNSQSKWIISYHTDDDKIRIKNTIDTIGIINYELVYSEDVIRVMNN